MLEILTGFVLEKALIRTATFKYSYTMRLLAFMHFCDKVKLARMCRLAL